MKERTTKILAGITATGMLFAFTACSKKDKIQSNNINNNSINIFDENNNPLICIILMDDNKKCNYNEYYGYIKSNNGQLVFYDVINKRNMIINNNKIKGLDVYYKPLNEFLDSYKKDNLEKYLYEYEYYYNTNYDSNYGPVIIDGRISYPEPKFGMVQDFYKLDSDHYFVDNNVNINNNSKTLSK